VFSFELSFVLSFVFKFSFVETCFLAVCIFLIDGPNCPLSPGPSVDTRLVLCVVFSLCLVLGLTVQKCVYPKLNLNTKLLCLVLSLLCVEFCVSIQFCIPTFLGSLCFFGRRSQLPTILRPTQRLVFSFVPGLCVSLCSVSSFIRFSI